jgi:hypothetical protein
MTTTKVLILTEDQGLVNQVFSDPSTRDVGLHCIEFNPESYFTSGGSNDVHRESVTAEKCVDIYMHDTSHPSFKDGRCYINKECLKDLYQSMGNTDSQKSDSSTTPTTPTTPDASQPTASAAPDVQTPDQSSTGATQPPQTPKQS